MEHVLRRMFRATRSNGAAGMPGPIDSEVNYEPQHPGVVRERTGARDRLLKAAIDFARSAQPGHVDVGSAG
jgi:hypothetical protein